MLERGLELALSAQSQDMEEDARDLLQQAIKIFEQAADAGTSDTALLAAEYKAKAVRQEQVNIYAGRIKSAVSDVQEQMAIARAAAELHTCLEQGFLDLARQLYRQCRQQRGSLGWIASEAAGVL